MRSFRFHLEFAGKASRVFRNLNPGLGRGPTSINLEVIPPELVARVRMSDLPRFKGSPPYKLWAGALKQMWRTKRSRHVKDVLEIPIAHLAATFSNRPDSEIAVGQLLAISLSACRKDRRIGEWKRIYSQACKLSARPSIRELVEKWVEGRERRFEARQRVATKRKLKIRSHMKLDWSFLDLVALAHWDRLKSIDRREALYFQMLKCIATVSEMEALNFESHDPMEFSTKDASGFYQWIKSRGFQGMKGGRMSRAEIIAKGYGTWGKVKKDSPPADTGSLLENLGRLINAFRNDP